MGRDGLRDVLATEFQPVLYVYADSVLGEVLRMRQGASQCAPEVFLDGRLLATAPATGAVVDGPQPRSALDSVRAQMRLESERTRVGSDQMYALSLLSSLTADALHGIEVYRSNEIPPTSLGAWFGMTKATTQTCGAVAVWTKSAARFQAASRNRPASGRSVQVISGTLVDFDTGKPVAGRSVALLTEARDRVGEPVVTDERGDFTLRTSRSGDVRLMAGGDNYRVSTTPPFHVSPNELVVVRLFVSGSQGVLAPLGVASRVLPQHIGVASLAGFTYRRERAQGGQFFRAVDIAHHGARSIAELLSGVGGLGSTCAASYYIDGVQATGDVTRTLNSLEVNRLFGIEIYTRESDFPDLYVDPPSCAVVVIWTKR
jgi:hypothetical protein